jgi:glycosyltransferase involved in cell wall biosynthesis
VSIDPRITLILLAYKQEAFVRDAVEGALAQDYPNLQILISDDCSPDATFEVIKDVVAGYRGPHDVDVMRTTQNLGMSRHLQTQIERAQGELIVFAAGDDVSAPQRTTRLVKAWQECGGGPAVIYSDCRMINLTGEVITSRSPVMRREPPSFQQACRGDLDVHGASSAMTLSLFKCFPPMDANVIHEDRVIPFRALLLSGKIIYIDEALVDYRFEGGISREPKDKDKARSFRLTGQRRALVDARQRLCDIRHIGNKPAEAEICCIKTIRDHEASIEFANSSSLLYEINFVRSVMRGARLRRTTRLYLRNRLEALKVISTIRLLQRYFQRWMRDI